MNWYKTLNIQQRINLKELSRVICGINFNDLTRIFGLRETIDMIYQKLKQSGFAI